MNDPLDGLQRGDSTPDLSVDQVVDEVIEDPTAFESLVHGLADKDEGVRRRSAAAIDAVTSMQPHLIVPYKSEILAAAEEADEEQLQKALASILPRLPLDPSERDQSLDILTRYLETGNVIVKLETIGSLGLLGKKAPEMRSDVRRLLQQYIGGSNPILETRAETVLEEIEGGSKSAE